MHRKTMMALGLAGAVLTGNADHANAQATPSAVHMALRARAQTQGTVRVMARLRGTERGIAAASASVMSRADSAAAQARTFGATAARRLHARPVVVMELDAAALDRAVASGLYDGLEEVFEVAPTLSTSVPTIGADIAQRSGSDGSGWDVAVLDTGVDNDHPSLNVVSEACYSSSGTSICPGGVRSSTAANSADGCTGAATGVFPCDHGTHVAGIVAGHACGGAGCSSADGVAPGAGIIAINVFHRTGTAPNFELSASTDDIIDGLDRVLALAATRNIAAVNLSFSSGLYDGHCNGVSSIFHDAVDDLRALGVSVVVSAGNDSSRTHIGWPACNSNVISVGNVTRSDEVDTFSNVSPKLSLWAPGTEIVSPIPGGTGQKSGTSMAAAHVAGLIALLKGYVADVSPAGVLDLLEETGIDVTDERFRGTITKPRIDAQLAAETLTRDQTSPQASSGMGSALAAGDFNDDGYGDLAVGAPGRQVGDASRAGMVHVYYGSYSSGASIVQQWTQASAGFPGAAENGDAFGQALAAGDFDGDGLDDLAISAPSEDLGDIADAGSVYILYGTKIGLSTEGAQSFSQGSASMQGAAEASDFFGSTLATGDFNEDDRDDLAVGIPFEDGASTTNSGAVQIIYGSDAGLSATTVPNQLWSQGSAGVPGAAESEDRLGTALATGDLNQDGADDLAIGVPGESIGDRTNAGGIVVIHGSSSGLGNGVLAPQVWSQDSASVQDQAEAGDGFGGALAIGNFNDRAGDDLAIGVPYEDIGSVVNAGGVTVLYSAGRAGLSASGNQFWHQDIPDLEGVCEGGDLFGSRLVSADFNVNGPDDLAVSAIGDDARAGVVHVIYGDPGSTVGLSAERDQLWSQDSTDIAGAEENDDLFGRELAAGNFDGYDGADLAVGVPGEEMGNVQNAGAVNVIYAEFGVGVRARGNEMLAE